MTKKNEPEGLNEDDLKVLKEGFTHELFLPVQFAKDADDPNKVMTATKIHIRPPTMSARDKVALDQLVALENTNTSIRDVAFDVITALGSFPEHKTFPMIDMYVELVSAADSFSVLQRCQLFIAGPRSGES